MLGPGDDSPGPMHVAAPAAYAWAIAAANAAVREPAVHPAVRASAAHPAVRVSAVNAEAAAWTVRGWADVAVGCLALDAPASPGSRGSAPDLSGAFTGLDEVVRAVPVVSAGQHAARLRRLRELAGPVPPWYPDARPVAGPIRGVGRFIWQAADLLARFGEELLMTGTGLPWGASCPLSSARQLAWGARYRPSPNGAYVTVRLPVNRFLARRTWMCLPGRPGPGPAVAEVPSTARPLAQQIWRGIHDLPTLAEVYVRGPLEVLTGGDAARALPEQIVGSLRARWRFACAAHRPAAAFASAAAELLGRPAPDPPMYTGYLLT